jgi:hypothetical protein
MMISVIVPVYNSEKRLHKCGGWDLGINKLSKLKNRYVQGSAYGAGISYGYAWVIENRWTIEFTAGVGMAQIEYDTYSVSTGAKDGMGRKKYYGPTKGAVSIVYTIR